MGVLYSTVRAVSALFAVALSEADIIYCTIIIPITINSTQDIREQSQPSTGSREPGTPVCPSTGGNHRTFAPWLVPEALWIERQGMIQASRFCGQKTGAT